MKKKFIIVGGGIAGMYVSHLIKKKYKDSSVILIEKDQKLGGLLQSFDYQNNGLFDIGVHTFYETGIDEIDNLFFSILPSGWKFLTEYQRDLGGSWMNGDFQYKTPYVSLMNYKKKYKEKFLQDFLSNLDLRSNFNQDCISYSNYRYGKLITENFIRPAIESKQKTKAENVHQIALKVQGLNRIALLKNSYVELLNQIPGFDSRICFPDQQKYPKKYLSTKRAYYPSQFGLGKFCDSFESLLLTQGVEILRGCSLVSLNHSSNKIKSVTYKKSTGELFEIDCNFLYWTVGISQLTKLVDLSVNNYHFDFFNKTAILNLLLKEKPNCSGIYYAYYHGHKLIHRISFGYNYSDNVGKHGYFPITVELILDSNEYQEENIKQVVIEQLKIDQVIQNRNEIIFSKLERVANGYPTLTMNNINNIIQIRDAAQKLYENIEFFGVLAKDNLFFQYDILVDIYNKISFNG